MFYRNCKQIFDIKGTKKEPHVVRFFFVSLLFVFFLGESFQEVDNTHDASKNKKHTDHAEEEGGQRRYEGAGVEILNEIHVINLLNLGPASAEGRRR